METGGASSLRDWSGKPALGKTKGLVNVFPVRGAERLTDLTGLQREGWAIEEARLPHRQGA